MSNCSWKSRILEEDSKLKDLHPSCTGTGLKKSSALSSKNRIIPISKTEFEKTRRIFNRTLTPSSKVIPSSGTYNKSNTQIILIQSLPLEGTPSYTQIDFLDRNSRNTFQNLLNTILSNIDCNLINLKTTRHLRLFYIKWRSEQEKRRFIKMEHSELVKELPHIEKLTNQERLKLAHNRRKLQLKQWNQYEKLLNNGTTGGVIGGSGISGGSKKGIGRNSQHQHQQQRLLEQIHQQELLKKSKSNKSSNRYKVRFRNSIMLLEAAGRNDIAEVRRLLQEGVDPDVANEDGLTALHQCCIDDNEEMMKLLVESGANVNAEDSEKWSPLHAAATCGHLHLVKHLVAKGADLLAVNAEGNMPYDICDEEATLDFIESEMAKRGVTQDLIEQIRALPETRMLDDIKRIQAEDGDLEFRDKDDATYLHIASANGYIRVVEFLLDNHVATDVQDKDCWQPVHAAACWSNVEVLELLVQNGADLNARTKNNETPYAICEDPEIKERIIQLRSEQETKMKEYGVKKLRRSVSTNSRTQSIRRTSQRDKGLTPKRDAADEAAMLLSIANTNPPKETSPTGDIGNNQSESLGILPSHTHQSSITSSEEDEIRSLPPWSHGRDSITQLHMEALGFPKSNPITNLEDTELSSSLEGSPKFNHAESNLISMKTPNLNHNNNRIVTTTVEGNSLNGSMVSHPKRNGSGHKSIALTCLPGHVQVSHPALTTDTNANLPKPDVTPLVDIQPSKLSNTSPIAPSSTSDLKDAGIRVTDSTDSLLSSNRGNSTIDIRVQVTITPSNNESSTGSIPVLSSTRTKMETTTTGSLSSTSHQHHFPNNETHFLFRNNSNTSNGSHGITQPGTLSDLKKHRSLQYISISRKSQLPGSTNDLKDCPSKYNPPASPTISLKKYTGNIGEVLGGDTTERHRKCCAIF